MNISTLEQIARQLVQKSKGILAADESTNTITQRLNSIKIESNEINRQRYRDLLLNSPDIEKYISGVILYDETFKQQSLDGVLFPKLLASKKILPGIKVDLGAHDLTNFPGEKITEGLDNLRNRMDEYSKLGAKFAKWRAVITIGQDMPSSQCIIANCHALARYAALCQEFDIVPIVEPEVLMDGNHSMEDCQSVTINANKILFSELVNFKVNLTGVILKPNMVVTGSAYTPKANPIDEAKATLTALSSAVPKNIPGIVFLSGGLSPDEATERLNLINQNSNNAPWELSFSFGRALQNEALTTWLGQDSNIASARKAFIHRLTLVSQARDGLLAK